MRSTHFRNCRHLAQLFLNQIAMLGITILPEYIQSEGPDALLDNLLARAPVTAVSTSPYVMEELSEKDGGKREPPADGGKGLARLLDRPLWGKHEVWVNTAPSFEPNESLYSNLRYKASQPTESTYKSGHIIDDFIKASHKRGIKVYFQIQAAIPPGYRVQFGGPLEEDAPQMPDGKTPTNRIDKNGSLANPHILAYGDALIRDLIERYPQIDGIRLDWPEYPPYDLESIFLDFSPHAAQFAQKHGFDFRKIQKQAQVLYHKLTEELDDAAIENSPDLIKCFQAEAKDWLNLKSEIVLSMLTRYRATMNAFGGKNMELIPSAFPWPWNELSGFDYKKIAKTVDAISCKYYTMHWPMMLKSYSESLARLNPNLSDAAIARFLVKSFEGASPTPHSCDSFQYPEPTENHRVCPTELTLKQKKVEAMIPGIPLWPIAHSYGPLEDFIRRSRAVYSNSNGRLWVNRYAYLSDKKLDALGEMLSKEQHKKTTSMGNR